MTAPPRHLRPRPHAIAQVIEGEAIVINLTTGAYYSLDGTSAMAWQILADGMPLDRAARAIALHYDVDTSVARTDLESLADRLVQEDLCEAADGPPAAGPEPPARNGPRLPYARLELHAYRDMADLLALDPPMPGLEDLARDTDVST